jgi:hypothetical protein
MERAFMHASAISEKAFGGDDPRPCKFSDGLLDKIYGFTTTRVQPRNFYETPSEVKSSLYA